MKKRLMFVSNSSSSSFVLFGVRFEEDDKEVEKIAKDSDLEVITGQYNTYIGLIESGEIEHDMVKGMRDDETRIQFQERIKKALPVELQSKADWYSESWYNG